MATHFKRLQQAESSLEGYSFTNICQTKTETSQLWAQSNRVRASTAVEAEVVQRIPGANENMEKIHIVNCIQFPLLTLILYVLSSTRIYKPANICLE